MNADDETLPEGTLVDGRYRIRREIARGGMGVVFEAEHVVLADVVALKMLRPAALPQPELRERIAREARALARVRHRSIVAIRDAGVCAARGPYVALERLEGRPLDGILGSRGQLSVPAVVALASQLGAALSHAHAAAIVHRDVKPGNVFVARAPGAATERAVLLDFGIAHLMEQGAQPAATRLTRGGDLLGTPEYMAPEVLLDGAAPSPRSDVFALAATLYECLAGDVPNAGRVMEIMTSHLLERPPASLATVRSDVPPELDLVLARALSRDPDRRPSSCDELAQRCADAVRSVHPLLTLLDDQPWSSAKHNSSAPTVCARPGSEPTDPHASRRQHARAPYVAPARVIGRAGACDGRTEDVSEGGLLLVCESARPAEGEEVSVRFSLPTSGRVVVVGARARWCRTRRGAHALGVEFAALPDAAREDIARYVHLMAVRTAPACAAWVSAPSPIEAHSVDRA